MNPYKHILFGLIFSLILIPFIGQWSIVLFLSTFLFDIDHYFYYAFTRKDYSLSKSIKFFINSEREKRKSKKSNGGVKYFLCIFHTYEFILLMIILSLFFEIFAVITLGLLFHLFLDFIDIKIYYYPAEKYHWISTYHELSNSKKL